MFTTLKKDLFGCFRIEEERGDENETRLKEGGVLEILILTTRGWYTIFTPRKTAFDCTHTKRMPQLVC